MKQFLIISLTLVLVSPVFSQISDNWIAFIDEETKLKGYKNTNGQVMINPKFHDFFTRAKEFEEVIAVAENKQSYYLNKSGEEFGRDSVYSVDLSYDCESEGYIRFKHHKTERIGMFDKDGNIVIPAIYNVLWPVKNGLIWAIKGAEKEYLSHHEEVACTHFRWVGGEKILLNTNNEVLIENIESKNRLNVYTLSIQETPSTDSTLVSLKGVDGRYYIFEDTEKVFRQWLLTELIPDLSVTKLERFSMDRLTFYKKSDGWISEPKEVVLQEYFDLIKERLNKFILDEPNCVVFIGANALSGNIYKTETYKKYFDNCGDANTMKYPLLSLYIQNRTKLEYLGSKQESVRFLKTDDGFRLISF